MKLTSLGASHLSNGVEGASAVLAAGKPLALLLYLSAAPNRSASRSTLVSLLWADLEPDAAKHALRQTIWYLKKKTEHDLVLADGDALRLSDVVTVDRDDLLRASRGGEHERVVALYAGSFVPSFAAPGCAGFEEWASLERRRLLEVFRHSAESVIARQLATGHAREAIALARRLRDADADNERGWRLLIEACVSADDMLAARAEAEALLQLAERDEVELEPATRATLRTVRTSTAVEPPGEEPPASTLVGREEVFSALLAAWSDTTRGTPARVHLTARAGHGKTRVLHDLATRIRAMRGRVITVGGALGMRDIDYAVAGDLAAALATLPGRQAIAPESAATLVALNPSLSTWFERPAKDIPHEDRLRARALAVRELMATVSFEHPVAILVDDLHWWDEASSALLAAAIDGLGDSRVLLVTAGRPQSRRAALVSSPATTHLTLDPLTAAQVEELVLSIASLPDTPWAATFAGDLWRASRGSPLLVLGMLLHLEERELLRRVDGEWRSPNSEMLNTELQEGDVLRTRLADLDRGELWLLTLLATGGSVLPPDVLVAASERGSEEVLERIASLEARGFVMREDGGWRVAHDEIADEVMRMAPADARTRASGRLGRTLAAGPFDEARARRAAQLLRHADDAGARADLFRAFGTRRYATGDRRSPAALVSDLLGAAARPAEIAELQRAAPLSWRLGLVSPARRTAALAGVLALIAFALLARPSRAVAPAPDAVLAVAFTDEAGRISYETVDISQAGWSPQDTLVAVPWTNPDLQLPPGEFYDAAFDEKRRALLTVESVTESGTIDLVMSSPGQPRHRFRSSDRDDDAPAFSPDGRLVVFITARWDSLYHYDLAYATMGDTNVRHLTSGHASDFAPRWTPDGSRVVFSRLNWGDGPDQICSVEVPNRNLTCRPVPSGVNGYTPVGWLDRDRLLVAVNEQTMNRLGVFQWSTGEVSTFLEGNVSLVRLSADGGWLFCDCPSEVDGELRPVIMPVAAPNLARPLRSTFGSGRRFARAFWLRSSATLAPTTVRIAPQPVAYAAIPTQMRATFSDARGNRLRAPGAARWRVTDAAAGTIDSLRGVLIPSGRRSAVTVVAVASTGDSSGDSLTIPVRRDSVRLVLDERWEQGLDDWFSFGQPAPQVARDAGGRGAFYNNGDGSFPSGALSHASFDASLGVALDVEVSLPFTMRQWQSIQVGLRALRDSVRYRDGLRWNAPPTVYAQDDFCVFTFPREGRSAAPYLMADVNARDHRMAARLERLADGRPWRARVQLFPDGRCGLAIDGTPVAIVDPDAAATGRAHVIVSGSSFETRVAVGRLRAYEGVLRDVDWSALAR